MIRAPQPEDAHRLAVIHITSWRHAYREDFPTEFLQGLDVDRRTRWFQAQIQRREGLLVADPGTGPVGFCFFGMSSDRDWGEVFAIYVLPDNWGEGHGHRLLAEAERRLASEGHERALLWVLESNRRARDFYERQGWRLGRPIRLEEIGGRQVTEVRYERILQPASPPAPDPRDR